MSGDWVAAGAFAAALSVPFCRMPPRLFASTHSIAPHRQGDQVRAPAGLRWPYWFGWPAPMTWYAAPPLHPTSKIHEKELQLVAVTFDGDQLVVDCVGPEPFTIRARLPEDGERAALQCRARSWLSSTEWISVRQQDTGDGICVCVVDDRSTVTLPVVG